MGEMRISIFVKFKVTYMYLNGNVINATNLRALPQPTSCVWHPAVVCAIVFGILINWIGFVPYLATVKRDKAPRCTPEKVNGTSKKGKGGLCTGKRASGTD